MYDMDLLILEISNDLPTTVFRHEGNLSKKPPATPRLLR
jgi:hypothetical protein